MTTEPNVVYWLTDGLTLDDVRLLRAGSDGPDIFSVSHFSAARPTPATFVATEAQMVRYRDLIDQAIDRARNITRNKPSTEDRLAEVDQLLETIRRKLTASLGLSGSPTLAELLDHIPDPEVAS